MTSNRRQGPTMDLVDASAVARTASASPGATDSVGGRRQTDGGDRRPRPYANRGERRYATPAAGGADGDSRTNPVDPTDGDDPTGLSDVAALRIGDVASLMGVSTRTLRYYEELGLITPSEYTLGGERRYTAADLRQLERILELKTLVGMNLEEVKATLASQARLDELRSAWHADDGAADDASDRRRAILAEALELRMGLITRMDDRISKMAAFRAELAADAERCSSLLTELEREAPTTTPPAERRTRGAR